MENGQKEGASLSSVQNGHYFLHFGKQFAQRGEILKIKIRFSQQNKKYFSENASGK